MVSTRKHGAIVERNGTSLQSPRVLIVEDEILVSWSLGEALKKAGFEVTVVECGEKAIEKLYSTRFDLAITDLKLPHIDGFEVAAAVKAFSPDVPIIMISTLDDQTSHEMAVKTHIDSFIEKPFDLNEIVSLAGHLIAQSKKCTARRT